MAFPDEALDVRVYLALGASRADGPGSWEWTDITSFVRTAEGIRISHGRPDEFSSANPQGVQLTLDNTDGRFVARNPSGAYYPNLRRGVPMRVDVEDAHGRVLDADTFTRSETDSWGSTSLRGNAWELTGVGGSPSDADFDVTGSAGTMSVSAASAFRRAYLLTDRALFLDHEVYGECTIPLPTGGAIEPAVTVRGRVTDGISEYYQLRAVVNPDASVTGQIRSVTTTGDTLVTSGTIAGLTFSAASPIKILGRVVGRHLYLKVWQGSTEPSTWSLSTTSTDITTAGWPGLRVGVASGNSNVKPVVGSWDNFEVRSLPTRASVYLDDLPLTWDPSATDCVARVTGSGVFRRLGQGDVVTPPLIRSWLASSRPQPISYHPLDDERDATAFGAVTPFTGPAFYLGDVSLGADTGLAGSGPMPTLGADCYLQATPNVTPTSGVTDAGIRWVHKLSSDPSSDTVLMNWDTPLGTVKHWRAVIQAGSPDGIRVEGYNAAGTLVTNSTSGTIAFTYGGYALCRFDAVQDGSDVDYTFDVYTYSVSAGALTGITLTGTHTTATLGNITRWWVYGYTGMLRATLGHVAVVDDPDHAPSDRAPWGYPGETAGSRANSVAEEAGLFVQALDGYGASLGPRPTGRTLSILRDVETGDGGVLREEGFGVGYLSLDERYAQEPVLTLDYTAANLAPGLAPTDDDLFLRNRIRVETDRGVKRTSEDEAHIALYDVYDTTLSLNLEDEDSVQDHADWRVTLGTVDDLRYQINIDLARNPSLMDDWCSVIPGSAARITSPPAPVSPNDIDVVVEGWSEYLGTHSWTATLNTSPGQPYLDTLVLDDGRLGSAQTELISAVDDDDTELRLFVGDEGLWSTSEEPYDLLLGGEQVTCTAMTAAGPTFVAAGTVAHADNTSVVPGLPAGLQDGDLLVLVCAIRDTTAFLNGVTSPGGWDILSLPWSNFGIFTKVYAAADFSGGPTVLVAGGGAGDTVSARLAAFRNLQSTSLGAVSSDNAAASSIAYGPLSPQRDNAVLLLAGWKQDDHTGVSAVSGFTEAFDSFSSTGDDQSLFLQYQIQTARQDIAAGSVSASGAVSAINRSILVALDGNVQRATVTRAVNDVDKSHAASASVGLWRPKHLAV